MSHGISKSNPLSYDRKRKSNYIRGEEEKDDHHGSIPSYQIFKGG
ncbi:hypothetical protein CULT_2540002 [[Clostridium] ultunense Esp]|nr:hypothetical protein CULT_2540002 [[Clostridium] ultunense Esp]